MPAMLPTLIHPRRVVLSRPLPGNFTPIPTSTLPSPPFTLLALPRPPSSRSSSATAETVLVADTVSPFSAAAVALASGDVAESRQSAGDHESPRFTPRNELAASSSSSSSSSLASPSSVSWTVSRHPSLLRLVPIAGHRTSPPSGQQMTRTMSEPPTTTDSVDSGRSEGVNDAAATTTPDDDDNKGVAGQYDLVPSSPADGGSKLARTVNGEGESQALGSTTASFAAVNKKKASGLSGGSPDQAVTSSSSSFSSSSSSSSSSSGLETSFPPVFVGASAAKRVDTSAGSSGDAFPPSPTTWVNVISAPLSFAPSTLPSPPPSSFPPPSSSSFSFSSLATDGGDNTRRTAGGLVSVVSEDASYYGDDGDWDVSGVLTSATITATSPASTLTSPLSSDSPLSFSARLTSVQPNVSSISIIASDEGTKEGISSASGNPVVNETEGQLEWRGDGGILTTYDAVSWGTDAATATATTAAATASAAAAGTTTTTVVPLRDGVGVVLTPSFTVATTTAAVNLLASTSLTDRSQPSSLDMASDDGGSAVADNTTCGGHTHTLPPSSPSPPPSPSPITTTRLETQPTTTLSPSFSHTTGTSSGNNSSNGDSNNSNNNNNSTVLLDSTGSSDSGGAESAFSSPSTASVVVTSPSAENGDGSGSAGHGGEGDNTTRGGGGGTEGSRDSGGTKTRSSGNGGGAGLSTFVSPTSCNGSLTLSSASGNCSAVGDRADTSDVPVLIVALPLCIIVLLIAAIVMSCLCIRRKKKKRQVHKSSQEDLWVDPSCSGQVPTISLSVLPPACSPLPALNAESLLLPTIPPLSLAAADAVLPPPTIHVETEEGEGREEGGGEPQTSKPRISSFLIRKKQKTQQQQQQQQQLGSRSLREHNSFSLGKINSQITTAGVSRSASALIPVTPVRLAPSSTSLRPDDLSASFKDKYFKVLFPYKAAYKGELSLREGELIQARDRDQSGWMLGRKLHGWEQGWFPAVYVDEIKDVSLVEKAIKTSEDRKLSYQLDHDVYGLLAVNRNKSPDQSWIGIEHVVSHTFAVKGSGGTQMSLHAGDTVTVVEALDCGWWLGYHGDQVGWFPGAYVQLLEERTEGELDVALPMGLAQHATSPLYTPLLNHHHHHHLLDVSTASNRSSLASSVDSRELLQDKAKVKPGHAPSRESVLSEGGGGGPGAGGEVGGVGERLRPARKAPAAPALPEMGGKQQQQQQHQLLLTVPQSDPTTAGVNGMAMTTLSRNPRPKRPAPAPPSHAKPRCQSMGSVDRVVGVGSGKLGVPHPHLHPHTPGAAIAAFTTPTPTPTHTPTHTLTPRRPRKPKVVRVPKERLGLDKISSCPVPSSPPPPLPAAEVASSSVPSPADHSPPADDGQGIHDSATKDSHTSPAIGRVGVCEPEVSDGATTPHRQSENIAEEEEKDVCETVGGKDVCETVGGKGVCETVGDKDVCETVGDRNVCETVASTGVSETGGDQDASLRNPGVPEDKNRHQCDSQNADADAKKCGSPQSPQQTPASEKSITGDSGSIPDDDGASKSSDSVSIPIDDSASKSNNSVPIPADDFASKSNNSVPIPADDFASKSNNSVPIPVDDGASKSSDSISILIDDGASKSSDSIPIPADDGASKSNNSVPIPVDDGASRSPESAGGEPSLFSEIFRALSGDLAISVSELTLPATSLCENDSLSAMPQASENTSRVSSPDCTGLVEDSPTLPVPPPLLLPELCDDDTENSASTDPDTTPHRRSWVMVEDPVCVRSSVISEEGCERSDGAEHNNRHSGASLLESFQSPLMVDVRAPSPIATTFASYIPPPSIVLEDAQESSVDDLGTSGRSSPASSENSSWSSSSSKPTGYWKFHSGSNGHSPRARPTKLTKVAPPVVPRTSADGGEEGVVEVPPAGTSGRVHKIVHQINRITSLDDPSIPPRKPSLQDSPAEAKEGVPVEHNFTPATTTTDLARDVPHSDERLSDCSTTALPELLTTRLSDSDHSASNDGSSHDSTIRYNDDHELSGDPREEGHDAAAAADDGHDHHHQQQRQSRSQSRSREGTPESEGEGGGDAGRQSSRKTRHAPPPPKSPPVSALRRLNVLTVADPKTTEC